MSDWEQVDIELSDKSINKVWICRDGKDSFIETSSCWTNISLDEDDVRKLLALFTKEDQSSLQSLQK